MVAARRAQLPGGTTVALLVAGAWVLVVAFALTGNGGIIHHAGLIQGGLPLWIATLVFLAGWQVMLWAMMVPASLAAIQERAAPLEKAFFIAGYMAVWSGFGLFAFLSDVGVHATVSNWPWLAFHPWLIAGGTLVLAGTYQLSNLKAASLAACRTVAREPSSGETGKSNEPAVRSRLWQQMLGRELGADAARICPRSRKRGHHGFDHGCHGL